MEPQPINILILEDDASAAELLVHELRRAGFAPNASQVDAEPAFRNALRPELDVILLDESVVGCNARQALQCVRERAWDIPCIVVTGAVDDEAVSECMKHGAADYLLKDRLARLGPAVRHALEQRRQREETRRVENDLRESERRQRTLLSNLPGMAYRGRNDWDWTLEFVSDGCTALTGYQPAELVDTGPIKYGRLIHPDDRQAVWDEVQHALHERRRFQLEYRITTKTGDTRWVWEQGCGLLGPDGKVRALEGFIADITERKFAEHRFQTTVEALPNPVLMVARDGTILLANRESERVFGYARQELIGSSVDALVPDRIRSIHPTYRNSFFNDPQIRTMGLTDCLTARRKNGSEFPVEIALNPMHTEAGPVVLIVAADVTRRHAAERAVRESEERYRSLMSASASVIWTAAPDAGFIEHQVSWQRFTGQSWDEQQGFGWLEAVHPDDRDRIRTLWQRAAAEGQACTSEGRVWHAASQRYRHFASRGVPLIGADGLIREWVATLTDIDDRKRQEAVLEEHARNMEELNAQLLASKSALEQAVDQLASSNRELDDFAYIASHDLKEPLRGIHNYAAFLLEDYADRVDNDGRQKLETLIRLSHRLNALIDALLNYSRLGRTELAIQPTNLNEVVDDVIDTVHVALNEKGVEIRMPRSLPTVDCDRVWVTELFRNLITNAMKYNDKPDPWIEIGAQHDYDPDSEGSPPTDRDPQPIALYVRDNGIGIPPKHHQAVFRIFKRLHGRDEYGGGSGAGLTIVQKIVARHGGRIWLESRTGHGTTFYFTLRGGHRHAQSRANRETARVAH